MADLSGFTYCEVQFTRDGAVFDEGEVTALLDALDAQDITDLVAISHGWNSITPMHLDLTDRGRLAKPPWEIEGFRVMVGPA